MYANLRRCYAFARSKYVCVVMLDDDDDDEASYRNALERWRMFTFAA